MRVQYFIILCLILSRGTSVDIAMGYGLDGLGSIPDRDRFFLFSIAFRPFLGSTQPSNRWVPGVKLPRREADHSPATSAEVNNGGTVPPFPGMSSWRNA
jgi:hypothetical protein